MPERTERVVSGVQKFFDTMAVPLREERVIRYIIGQLREGRTFDSVMADPYVANLTDGVIRSQLLQNPRILRGIEEEICREFTDYRKSGGA